jgi:spore germination protein YaaH
MSQINRSTVFASLLGFICTLLFIIFSGFPQKAQKVISPLAANMYGIEPLTQSKSNHEVYGFLPHWQLNTVKNIDFNVLTTLAYFDIKIDSAGNIITDDPGYQLFKSNRASALFKEAHNHGTRVALTITQMNPPDIETLMDDQVGQANAIEQVVKLIQDRGIDDLNIDVEYGSNPGQAKRDQFTFFVENFNKAMHSVNPNSKVTVSVYASAIKDPKIYDIAALGKVTDSIFIMAYDYTSIGSDYALPTAPLTGYKKVRSNEKDGVWYDVATAVKDFTTQIPANKIILGTPLYGLDFVVDKPEMKAETLPYWSGTPKIRQLSYAQEDITPTMPGIDAFKSGFDTETKTAWKAYRLAGSNTWRFLVYDDIKSLGVKYEFAKSSNLLGVGMWALGFEDGNKDFWNLLRDKFGVKLADNNVLFKTIRDNI